MASIDQSPIQRIVQVTADGTPVYANNGIGLLVSDAQTLVANNTTANVPIFNVTGSVQVTALYGIVTTALSSNITAAFWRFNDQTAQSNMTLAAGTTLSSAVAGSAIAKITTTGSALTFLNSSANRFNETAANHMTFQEFLLVAKSGANSNIEFTYTTTNTPATGVIQFFCRYTPVSADGNVTPL